MPTLAEFYAPKHRGGAFGILPNSKYYGPTGHRGYDINGHPGGTQIPAFRAGLVVVNAWSDGLGWVLVTYDAGEWFGYSHLQSQSPLDIGEYVDLGSPIGPLGNTGRLSAGNHVHITVSNASNSPWRGSTKDPFPYILAALGSSVATITTEKLPAPVNPAQRKGTDMKQYFRRDSDGKLALFANGVKPFGSQEDYDRHRLIEGLYATKYPNAGIIVPPDSNNRDNFFNLSDDDWNLKVAIHGGYY